MITGINILYGRCLLKLFGHIYHPGHLVQPEHQTFPAVLATSPGGQ